MARFGDREHMKFPSYLLSLLLCYQTNPVGLHVKPRFYVPCHKTFPHSTVTISSSLLQCRAQSIRYKVNDYPHYLTYFLTLSADPSPVSDCESVTFLEYIGGTMSAVVGLH